MSRRRIVVGVAVAAFCVLVGGCAREMADSAPFEGAIARYLAAQSMGMKVNRFRELSVSGNEATAVVSLTQADDAVGISVTWEFDFVKVDGGWRVAECRR